VTRRRLSVRVELDGALDRERLFAYARAADDAGVEALFVPETWGRDVFSLLVQLAERTRSIRLGPGIVNVYSRSPAALAQHLATLDEISEGRAVAGFGTSGPLVIEHFHGVPFARPARRLRETIEVFRILAGGRRLRYQGELFRLERGFSLRFTPVRDRIPVYLASFRPAGVRVAAELADGWMPLMIPLDRLPGEVARFRARVAGAGRDPAAVTVRAPGEVVVAADLDAARARYRRTIAFYVARMGEFYATHLAEMGRGEDVAAIRAAWAAGGSAAGGAAVSDDLLGALARIGDVEACIDRLDEQAAAGVDLHQVAVVDEDDPVRLRRAFARLVG
jgi:alkanesulfonate monooxygenase SsuD/methylene tetrahydromethanopterin reductase-like flavin-dependent oxidoreductase (luciferase family)